MGNKISDIRQMFGNEDFDIARIATETGASPNTVKVQLYKWKKEKGIVKPVKVKKVTNKKAPKEEEPISSEPYLFDTTVTKTEFLKYERVRRAGVSNMFNTVAVQNHSGLSKDKILQIMKEYNDLVKKYPEVGL